MPASGPASRRSRSSPSRRRARKRRAEREAGAAPMAMNVGTPSRSSDMDVMIDINTTPIQLHAVNLNLPIGNPPPPLTLPEVVRIDIDDQSKVYWNGEVVPDRATLETKIGEAAHENPQPEVHLRPNKLAKYAVVAEVMASAQRLGL